MHTSGSFLDTIISSESYNSIFPRKGGGGGGGGHGSSGGGRGSSSGKTSSGSASSSKAGSAVGVPYSSKTTASSSSRGGGTPAVIPNDSLFAGRLYGGATRDQIYGTSRIGSGYPYGAYGTFYGGRPFPYGFYPLYLGPGYYGGDEYGANANATRPGGALSTVIVQPNGNTSSINTFYLIGDQSSVSLVLSSLMPQCGIANASVTPALFNSTQPNSFNTSQLIPRPEQVIQYYRASSFALALISYNNNATLPANAPSSNSSAPPPASADTPLPAGLNYTLLACLNTTIAANLPLLDNVSTKHGLSSEDITWIVIGCLSGLALLVVIFPSWFTGRCSKK